MTSIIEASQQANLALAAYATLTKGISDKAYTNALEKVGMSESEAKEFAKHWEVVDSATFDENGASAMILGAVTNEWRISV